MQIVNKLWGYEQVIVNNDKYCAKLLHIHPGWECSLHYHPVKKETFICVEGQVEVDLEVGGLIRQQPLRLCQQLTINPGTAHRFRAANDEFAVLLEISSTHSDEDVVRLEDSRSTSYKTLEDLPAQCKHDFTEYGQEYANMILNWRADGQR